MDRTDTPRRRTWVNRVLAGLILVSGLIVAGLVGSEALIARGLRARIVERRAELASTDDLAGQVNMVRARKDLINAECQLIGTLRPAPDPTPGWERVLAAVPAEAMAGRGRFCSEGSEVTIHGRRGGEAHLARVASALEASTAIQRTKVSGQGSDDVVLTIVPKPLTPSQETPAR